MAGAVPVIAQGATLTIQGTIFDGTNTTPFTATVTTTPADVVTISSVTVVPQNAVAGTVRTLTVVATSSLGLPLTANLTGISGIVFAAVPNQPAGTFKWTFPY
jgi:hypothetical protein